jgi:hypothetical protein
MVEGGVHLVKDTTNAAVDVGHYGAKAIFEGDAEAKEKVASRALDIVLNIADVVTLADGAGAAKNAVVGGGKALAAGGKSLVTTMKDAATGGSLVTTEGVVISSGKALTTTGKGSATLANAAKGTALTMSQSKNVAGGSGGGSKRLAVSAGTMSEAEFRAAMKQNYGVYVYRLVDEQGNVLKWGTAKDPFQRISGLKKTESFFEMEVVAGPHARPQALAGETAGVEASGEATLNVRRNTLAEMKGGAEWLGEIEVPAIYEKSKPLISIRNPGH